ncbi:DUF4426 domain-containing protein [Luteimonas sp. RD2P54]|uniref:DUF4426 domain-containing protein n=1 Tax=Luteimonas endophytica TaxID=3042023 RepID=A0ABT6JAA1_9GAMM|nr:DUF4426 domain-containing protein [Luteimonas endophytica]MDH5823505.1 DUF4426 domain-containing protein [Luteimonas endophytica]
MTRAVLLLAAGLGLAACSAPAPPPEHGTRTREEAVLRSGDVVIRASVMPTLDLNEAMAREYGIERNPRSVLLLVGLREGPAMQETSVPAVISGNAIDLRGVRQPLELREIRSGGPENPLIDYVGTVRVTPPDTLRFDIEIVQQDGTRADLRFSRDLYPK